jgi:hypothetical protein
MKKIAANIWIGDYLKKIRANRRDLDSGWWVLLYKYNTTATVEEPLHHNHALARETFRVLFNDTPLMFDFFISHLITFLFEIWKN